MIDNSCEPSQSYTEDEFIGLVQQELSVSCALPFTIPVNEIKRIIK